YAQDTRSLTLKECRQAATSGATGALVGEIVAEALQTASFNNLLQQKNKLSQEQFNEIYQKHLKNAALTGKLINLAAAYHLSLDIEIASRTAENAIENNFLATAFTIGIIAWTLYDAYYKIQEAQEIYQKQGWEAARNYALKEISKEVLLYIAAAGTSKLLGKLAKTPAAKKFLGTLQKEITAVAKKVPQGVKKIGAKLEHKGVKAGGKKALQTRLKTTTHRKDYVAKLAKNKKTPKIGPIGDPSAKFRNAAPKNWIIKTANNGKGTKYINPKNLHDYIRFSTENLHPNAPLGQRYPYFQRYLDGKVLTRDGKWVNPKTYFNKADFHIPQDLYEKYSHLLKFNKK
ncbi:MAG: hypothetical protein AAF380_02475, partial [Bacteroidota bacterium]